MTGYESKRAAAQDKLDDDDTQVYQDDTLTIAYQSGYYDGKKAAAARDKLDSMEREALKLVLEALIDIIEGSRIDSVGNRNDDGLIDHNGHHDFKKRVNSAHDAITVARAALAQTQEPVCPACKAEVLYECVACSNNNYPPQPAQEPVAYLCKPDQHGLFDRPTPDKACKDCFPVYAAPPQRTWVGLTDEEIGEIHSVAEGQSVGVATGLTERKLKEKNNAA